ncbi:hypothetical protein ACWDWT_29075 [Streptomyces sp. NPDC003343]
MTSRTNVLTDYRNALAGIRADSKMSDAARQLAAAQAYTSARSRMAIATREHRVKQSARWDQLERNLWGLPQTSIYATATEQAAQAMAMRDALQRASGIRTEGEAANLLRQAEQTGDETLARAVAQQANEHDWTDVLVSFLDARKGARAEYDEMCALHHERTRGKLADDVAHSIGKPEELRGMDDKQIQQLATDAGHLVG